MSHTPRQWEIAGHLVVDCLPDGYALTIAQVMDSSSARLIAAAPDLLAALKGLVELGTDSPRHLAAEAAIAKAERK